ncbi:MAG: AI-2E family transporter, partial [Clostridiaceae bacterium]|nr:AI-2E family transporter [Clostridiaceae bacterium]
MKRKILFYIICLLALFFLYFAWAAFMPLFFGAILAYIVAPSITWLEGKGIKRCLALSIVYIIVGIALFFVFWFAIPYFISAISTFQKVVTEYANNEKFPVDIFNNIFKQLQNTAFDYIGKSVSTLFSALGSIVNVIIGLVISFYMVLDKEKILSALLRLIPKNRRDFTISVAIKANNTIKQYLKGLVGISLSIGFLAFCGLTFLKIRNALLLAAFAGVFEVIPYFGGIIGALPAVIAAAAYSHQKVIWTIV